MIGKTYYRMKNYDKAKEYLLKARAFPVKTPDDKDVIFILFSLELLNCLRIIYLFFPLNIKAHKEAVDLLKSLGVKS